MAARFQPIILFVKRFDECLEFYRKVFGLKLLRLYGGPDHPEWAELEVGGVRFCLHAKYRRKARYHPGRPLAMHFDVKSIRKTLQKVKRYGGAVVHPVTRYDFRPAELQIALGAAVRDPDGNVFEVQQVLKEFDS